jgi:hypothetical protein
MQETIGMDTKTYSFTLSDQEWRAKLSPEQYYVMRSHGTSQLRADALKTPGNLHLCRLRTEAVPLRRQVRKRHRLAELR